MTHSAKFQGAMTLALCGKPKAEMIREKDHVAVIDRDVSCPACVRKLTLERVETKQRAR